MNKSLPQGNRLGSIDHCIGFIGAPKKNVIPGWVASISEDIIPILFINGRPAELINWPLPRADVNEALGLPGNWGFEFSAEGLNIGDTVELYVFDGQSTYFVNQRISTHRIPSECFFQQIVEAKDISMQSDSVAITCWDGAHNPLGRAYTLYQAIKPHRPVVLISFLFDEFGPGIWPPLVGVGMDKVMIPWGRRQEIFEMMGAIGLSFPTIWMCKPRFPNFELVSNLTNSDTKLILDHDDNEQHFAMQTTADRVYGPKSVSLAAHLQSQITAHTAASKSLAVEQKAELVRHVRKKIEIPAIEKSDLGAVKIGFIGTVRPHKGIIEAARAIKMASWEMKREIEFHVYGIFEPASIMKELSSLGVVVKDNIPNDDLQFMLSEFNVVLTGFPSRVESYTSITKYQISSKIGDALATGLPVLVPFSESVADLHGTPGVFTFTYEKFNDAVRAAIAYEGTVALPESFTLDDAYKSFQIAEKSASEPPQELNLLKDCVATQDEALKPALLIIWKQNDAGLYGRRLDQVARSYKDKYPDHRVIVLEFCHAATLGSLAKQVFEFSHDAKFILPLTEKKLKRAFSDKFGVEYHALEFQTDAALREAFISYLLSEALLPQNTKIVLYPVIGALEHVYDILALYRCVADIVDNQFAWANSRSRLKFGQQYSSTLRLAKAAIFNSVENRKFFEESGFIKQTEASQVRSAVIQNWYFKGSKDNQSKDRSDNTVLIYSGNMNDRVDWRLLEAISDIGPEVTLYLVGLARRSIDKLAILADRENVVYWGPLPEGKVSELLGRADAGIVPHVQDPVSTFMNPLKVHMYKAHGLPVIATSVPGIDKDGVFSCENRSEFLAAVKELIAQKEVSQSERQADQTSETLDETSSLHEMSIDLDPEKDLGDPMVRYLDVLEALDE